MLGGRDQRCRGITFDQGQCSYGINGHRNQCIARLALGDLLELAAGAAGDLDVSDFQHDLHMPGAAQRFMGSGVSLTARRIAPAAASSPCASRKARPGCGPRPPVRVAVTASAAANCPRRRWISCR